MWVKVMRLSQYWVVIFCVLQLSYCKPQHKQVFLDDPINPQKSTVQNPDTTQAGQPAPKDQTNSKATNSANSIIINARLENICQHDVKSPDQNDSENINSENNNSADAVVSELEEAKKIGMGRRAGLEPGEKAPVISIEHGAMYLQRDQEGTYTIKPAFENNAYFTQHIFTLGEDQLTPDEENFKYNSLNDKDTEFYISVQSPEFGLQNCAVKEVCEDTEENLQSNLYLLRHHDLMLDNLKQKAVPQAEIFKNKQYDVYALSPQLHQFCKNQTAKIDTHQNKQNQAEDSVSDPEQNDPSTSASYELALKQAETLTIATQNNPDSTEEEEAFDQEQKKTKADNFTVYFTQGKDNQAIIYFIADKVWYMALEKLPLK